MYVGVDKIRCAIKVVPLADPNAAVICGLPDVPIVGELTGDGIDDVFVYRAGPDPEGLFPGAASRQQTSRPASRVNGIYTPVTGDFNGDGIDDILWYAPGTGKDYVWYQRSDGAHTSRPTWINGSYRVAAGDHDGDGRDDVVFLAPEGGSDAVWFGVAPYGFARATRSY